MEGRLHRWLHRLAEWSGIVALVHYFHRQHDGRRLGRFLYRVRHARSYPVVVAALAMISAGTGLYPFGPVIVAATVFAPDRWRTTFLGASLGAAVGGMLCAVVIETAGIQIVDSIFPGIRQHAYWERSAYWIGEHGALALAAIAALPVPQMPALIVSALGELQPATIGCALFIGKLVKYGLYIGAVRLVLATIHRVQIAHHRDPGK